MLAGGGRAIMTGRTRGSNTGMVKACGYPSIGSMAIIAGVIGLKMCWMLAGGSRAIVTG